MFLEICRIFFLSSVSWKCTLMYLSIFIDHKAQCGPFWKITYFSLGNDFKLFISFFISIFFFLSFWNPHNADVELPKFLPEYSYIFNFFIWGEGVFPQPFFRIFNFCHHIFKTLLTSKISLCSLNVHFYKFAFLSHECNTFFFLWGILMKGFAFCVFVCFVFLLRVSVSCKCFLFA